MSAAAAEKARMPELRFSDFEGAWEEKSLEEISATITSGSRDWAQYYASHGAKFMRMTNLSRDGVQLLLDDLKYVKLPSTGSEGARTSLVAGDILISITAELGKIGLVPDEFGEAYINQHTALVRPKLEEFSPKFIAQKLATKDSNKRLNRLNDSGAKSGLNLSTIKGFNLKLPSLPEQKKIAGFLGAVDGKLVALREKEAALARFKRGLMQKLFSQTLRFTRPDGSPYPDWEEKKLGDVADINPTSLNLPAEFHYIDLESVANGTLQGTQILEAGTAPSRAQRLLEQGDILYQTVRPYQRNNLYFCLQGEYVASTGYAQIRTLENKKFLFQLLHTDNFVNDVMKRCTGTSYPAINSSDLVEVTIQIPHPEEQQKIADALSAMDAKINAVTDQITRLETFKRGLLQKMFV